MRIILSILMIVSGCNQEEYDPLTALCFMLVFGTVFTFLLMRKDNVK